MTSVVVVTGHSSGIGRAVVEAVPWGEAQVLGVSREAGEAHRLPSGATLEPVPADLSTSVGCAAVVEALGHALEAGSPDRVVLVHAAATLEPMRFAADADSEAYARGVRLDSLAPQLLGQAFLQRSAHLASRATRTLLFLTTGSSSVYPGWSVYKAGKAATDAWVTQVGAEEERRPHGAVVLAVAPGVVDTAMQERIRAADPDDFPDREKFEGLHERGELRDPAEVARELWRLVEDPPPSGTVLDLRDRRETTTADTTRSDG